MAKQHDLINHKVSFFPLSYDAKAKLKQIPRLVDMMMTLLVKFKTNCNVQFVGYH